MDVSLLNISRESQKYCVVCGVDAPDSDCGCKELLYNVNVGAFLVRLEVVPAESVSFDKRVCRTCFHFAVTADRAWTIVDDNVAMLKGRRRDFLKKSEKPDDAPKLGGSEGRAPLPNAGNTQNSGIFPIALEVTSGSSANGRAPSAKKSSAGKLKSKPNSGLGPYSCRVCEHCFSDEADRVRHEKRVHRNAKIHEVPTKYWCRSLDCDKFFTTARQRNLHEAAMHKSPPSVHDTRSVLVEAASNKPPSPSSSNIPPKDPQSQVTPPVGPACRHPTQQLGSSDGKRTCPLCHKVYRTPANVIRHLEEVHRVVGAPRQRSASGPGEVSKPPMVPASPSDCDVQDYSKCRDLRGDEAGISRSSSSGSGVSRRRTSEAGSSEGDRTEVNEVVRTPTKKAAVKSHVTPNKAQFPCPDCSSAFAKKSERQSHVETRHPDACRCCGNLWKICLEEEQNEGFCEPCEVNLKHHNAHVVWKHKAKYCRACTAIFATRDALDTHVKGSCFMDDVGSEGGRSQPSSSSGSEPELIDLVN